MQFEVISDFVAEILKNPFQRKWTLQGLGMLRTSLSDTTRLHIWSPDHAVKNVSAIHSHPWSFQSLVLCGEVCNREYEWTLTLGESSSMCMGVIECGVGLQEDSPTIPVEINEIHSYRISPRGMYNQSYNDLHSSTSVPGTVTVIRKKYDRPKRSNQVWVAWEVEKGFVSAAARPAEEHEIAEIVELARKRFNQ